jgi:hypothetical protein
MSARRNAMRVLAIVLPALPALACAAWSLDCPPQLATAQSLAVPPPAGWSALGRTPSAVRDAAAGTAIVEASPPVSISVFDGPPAAMADLVPDNPNARVPRWTFGKARPRDIYVVCNYADTRLKLAHQVPAEVSSCAVGAGPGTRIDCR